MNYKDEIIKLLDKIADDSFLRKIYSFVKAFVQ